MHRYEDETSRKIFGQKDICGQIGKVSLRRDVDRI